jgi:hypothetical protein
VDGSQPSMLHVEQLFPCALLEVANSLLSYSILEMNIDAAEGETLICACACIFEIVVGISTIVAMIIQDLHTMLLSKAGLASTVSCEVRRVIRWMYCKRE